VLAGHSFGGLYILTFAANYPGQVAGMVLLDSTAPASAPGPPPKTGSYNLIGRISAFLPAMAHLGVARLYAQFSYDTLPPRSRDEARARSATASDVESFINEFREGPMAVQAASLNDFAGKPLIVITAGRGHDAKWLSAQKDLATLSTNSRHRVVADATHASLLLDPIRLMPPQPARQFATWSRPCGLPAHSTNGRAHEPYRPAPSHWTIFDSRCYIPTATKIRKKAEQRHRLPARRPLLHRRPAGRQPPSPRAGHPRG
jgi:pimeloyl-ACP methyl ester carboxylesterase